MFRRVLLLRWVLSSTLDGRSLLAEVRVAGCEIMDLDANEAGSVHFGQCFFLRWMCYVVD